MCIGPINTLRNISYVGFVHPYVELSGFARISLCKYRDACILNVLIFRSDRSFLHCSCPAVESRGVDVGV